VALFTQDLKVKALGRAPLFSELSKKDLTTLARLSEDVEIKAGTALCKQGQIGREFFVIVDGQVDVTRNGKPVKRSGGDEFFGEIALLEDVPRTATVTAKTPVRAFVLTSQHFRQLVKDSPSVERKVLRSLAQRLADLSNELLRLSQDLEQGRSGYFL
jgi:CRP/FNR family transcriptional regulator, cyclic AMP receptor protein